MLKFLEENYSPLLHQESYPTPPHLLIGPSVDLLKTREAFCRSLGAYGIACWQEYQTRLNDALRECERVIVPLLEKHFGMHALHPGDFPNQWKLPGGLKEHNYPPSDVDRMMSSRDVVATRVLKRAKLTQEDDLFNYCANYTNICKSHKCDPNYCLKDVRRYDKYDAARHSAVDPDKIITKDGVQLVVVTVKECRFDFGKVRSYDPSGEKDLTRGRPPVLRPKLFTDKNGMLKINMRRNNPRTTQEPHLSYLWGANTNTVPLFILPSPEQHLHGLGVEAFVQRMNNLDSAGFAGLDSATAKHVLDMYIMKYTMKPEHSSANSDIARRSLTQSYCQQHFDTDRRLRNLVGKHMHEITNSESQTNQQVAFVDGGGKTTFTNRKRPRKVSVTATSISGIASIADGSKSYTWKTICDRYKIRPPDIGHLNLFQYIYHHWSATETTTPQIYGYHDVATCPLRENYAKYTLAIFKPWRHSLDSNKHVDGTFASTLDEFLFDELLPDKTRTQILRARYNREADMSEASSFVANVAGSQASNRSNTAATNAAAAADAAGGPEAAQQQEIDCMTADALQQLDDRVDENHDWSDGYNPDLQHALETYQKNFYADLNKSILDGTVDDEQVFFDEHKFRPENAHPDEQQLIVCQHLLFHFIKCKWEEEHQSSPDLLPLCENLFVEGVAGSGKTFVIMTTRNITIAVENRNSADMASAPTGCAASLIRAKTNCRSCNLPAGPTIHKKPHHSTAKGTRTTQALRRVMSAVVYRQMDEHSMNGRVHWGWLEYRHAEHRVIAHVLDANMNVVRFDANDVLIPELAERRWGGIFKIASYGDHAQLLPIQINPVFSTRPAKPGSGDAVGSVSFSNFINPPDGDEGPTARSTCVYMDKILRQDDPDLLRLLAHMRDGEMDNADVELILSRCLENLEPREKASFDNAIHLSPTWAEAYPVIVDHLANVLTGPIAKIQAKLTSKWTTNCHLKEKTLPVYNALCPGGKVMLGVNFVVEQFIFNGSVGNLVAIKFADPAGPNADDPEGYAIVDFPLSTIPAHKNLIPGMPSTHVPIPMVKMRCERKCCGIETFPLRMADALTGHKAQGMTIAKNEPFEKAVLHFPTSATKHNTVGLEYVMTGRVKLLPDFAIGNKVADLDRRTLLKIGTTPTDVQRRLFQQMIRDRYEQVDRPRIMAEIAAVDPADVKTYEGGCRFLRRWYRKKFWNWPDPRPDNGPP